MIDRRLREALELKNGKLEDEDFEAIYKMTEMYVRYMHDTRNCRHTFKDILNVAECVQLVVWSDREADLGQKKRVPKERLNNLFN